MKQDKRKIERVTIMLSASEKRQLEKMATVAKMPVSAFLRDLIFGDGKEEKKNQ